MVDFNKVIEMVELILKNEIYDNKSFNDFCIEFYLETRALPLSKFLRLKGYGSKLPKLMNTRKAGEVLYETQNNKENFKILEKYSYEEIPQLNYSAIMLLRKTTLERNWRKLVDYLEGRGTIEEISRKNSKILLPEEKEKLENYIKKELGISSGELEWFLAKAPLLFENKKVYNALKRMIYN